MSLPLLAAIVVIGVAVVVYAVHRTGGSRVATLEDAEHARSRFAEDFPDLETGDVLLTENGWTGFIDLGQGRTGIVSSVGGRFLTRIVTNDDIAGLEAQGDRVLDIRFRDFTWRGGAFAFAAPEDADKARAMLAHEPLMEEDHAAL